MRKEGSEFGLSVIDHEYIHNLLASVYLQMKTIIFIFISLNYLDYTAGLYI
jgi:hypothetical protein